MATHSSVLAWRIPGTGEPDGLLTMGSHRVGHDWSDLAAATAAECSGVNNTFFNSPTPTGSPAIQFSSDTNCLKLMQTPQLKGSVLQDGSHIRSQVQVLGHLYF